MKKSKQSSKKQTSLDPILSPAEILNFKKLTLMHLQSALHDLALEEIMMKQIQDELQQRQAEELKLIAELDRQILIQKDIFQNLRDEHEKLLSDKPQKVIGQFEATIQKNLKIARQLENRLQQLQNQLSIAKMQKTLQLEQNCLKKSTLDSIILKKQKIIEEIKQKKLQNHKIERILEKTSTQQQQMFNLKKKLNNQLQQNKGNIRVYCRVRPNKSKQSAISITSDNTLKITQSKQNVTDANNKQSYELSFYFEQIFSETDNQDRVFAEISQLVQSSIDGKNVCIFAYGQTGSGKTYTLIGPDVMFNQSLADYNERGLTPRSIEFIFHEIELCETFKWKYRAYLSIQQIYLETVIDLVAKSSTTMDKIKEIQVFSVENVETRLRQAKLSRKTATTNMNERSSRSHLIVTLRLEGINETTNQIRNGSLVLVDLAGSERIKQSKVEGDCLKQTQFINKSLSNLGSVINGIRRKSEHIPFRNSKLTHVLQRYLEGDSKTLMFVNISPDKEDAFQTKISLSFAQGVRQCKFNKK